jgi:hypothetical protein
LTSIATNGSGGINTAAYSRNTEAVALRAAPPRWSKAWQVAVVVAARRWRQKATAAVPAAAAR